MFLIVFIMFVQTIAFCFFNLYFDIKFKIEWKKNTVHFFLLHLSTIKVFHFFFFYYCCSCCSFFPLYFHYSHCLNINLKLKYRLGNKKVFFLQKKKTWNISAPSAAFGACFMEKIWKCINYFCILKQTTKMKYNFYLEKYF